MRHQGTLFARCVAAAAVVCCLGLPTGAGTPATQAGPAPIVTDLPLPGGVERLLRRAGVPGLADPAIAIPAFIRAVHVLPAKPRTDVAALFDPGRSDAASAASESVPLPLTAPWWARTVLGRQVGPGELAAAILGDRRAAFLYLGMLSLDDETLAYFASNPRVIEAMPGRAAGAFAQWGRSVHIVGGRVQVPGGPAAAPAWQALVGESPDAPDQFVGELFSKEGGRLAYFYDTVMHLDRERQAFALAASSDGGQRVERVKALYSSFQATRTLLTDGDWPTVRHPFGPAALLRQVRVAADGRMQAPVGRAFWEAVIDGGGAGCARVDRSKAEADAAWLVSRLEAQPVEARDHWVAAVAFAQRVFAAAEPAEMAAACEATAGFPRSDALLLALERVGLRRPADYVAVLRFTERIWSGSDRRAAVLRTAQVQGILQVLQQAVSVRGLSPERGRELVLGLAALPSGEGGALRAGAVGRWIEDTLLPAACPGLASADACLARVVSGEGRTDGVAGTVEWEDERYRVDLGAAPAVILQRVRRAQRATSVDEALAVLAAAALVGAGQRATPGDVERAATVVRAVAPAVTLKGPTLFGHPVASVRPALEAALTGLAPDGDEPARRAAAASLADAGDLLLADALASFAYAVAIGDPDDAVLMGGNPARAHLFDGTIGPATPPWHLPEEVQALDRSRLVEGSVLMLHTIYARSWLRRLSIHDPGAAVRADPRDVHVFGETATAFSPHDLDDAGRDRIVAAIRRGRRRVVELVWVPGEFWKAARAAGLGEWRCRAALWASHRRLESDRLGYPPADPTRYFSLVELMRLGEPDAAPAAVDAWGVATRPLDGALSVRMPRTGTWEDHQGPRGVGQLPSQMADVHLAVAEALADLKLPAALAPAVAAQAAWDVMAGARMAHRDDWFALVRAAQSIPRDRFLDYVSALTAIGPLVPAR